MTCVLLVVVLYLHDLWESSHINWFASLKYQDLINANRPFEFFWKSWVKVPSEYQRRYISRLNTKPLNKRALNPGTT